MLVILNYNGTGKGYATVLLVTVIAAELRIVRVVRLSPLTF